MPVKTVLNAKNTKNKEERKNNAEKEQHLPHTCSTRSPTRFEDHLNERLIKSSVSLNVTKSYD